MMGRQKDGQDQFLYQFRLEDYVPEDHLLRHIERVLDLQGLHKHWRPSIATLGDRRSIRS